MWIHESFTNYSESLFVEYYFGKEAGSEYVRGTRKGINNDLPIIPGAYNVNVRGSGDMYPKGGNMIHMLRQLTGDDEKWRMILRGMNEKFYHQVVSTDEIEDFLSDQLDRDLAPIFNQYLRDYRLPVLEYLFKENTLEFRWSNSIREFNLPVKVSIGEKEQWLEPTTKWQRLEVNSTMGGLIVNPDFYVSTLNISGN